MRIAQTGSLKKSSVWEELLATLGTAEGPEDLGKFWGHISPAREEGNDPLSVEAHRVQVIRGVEFEIPANSEIRVGLKNAAADVTYTLIRVGKTSIHLRDGVVIETDEDGVHFVRGDVHVCVRVFNPLGADTREPTEEGGRIAWRNYLMFLDILPLKKVEATEVEATDMYVFPEGEERNPVIALGVKQKGGVYWSSRSVHWNPILGTGFDQCICFHPLP